MIWYAFGTFEPPARRWRGSAVPAEGLEWWAASARAGNGVAIHDPTAHFFQKLPRLAVLSAHQRTRDRVSPRSIDRLNNCVGVQIHRSIPLKVLGPYVASGMEQTDNLLSIGIDTCYIRSFETIAVDARQREILKLGLAPMLPGDDVIYLERRRVKRRWQLTVLTTIRCTLPDSSNEISVQNVLLSRML